MPVGFSNMDACWAFVLCGAADSMFYWSKMWDRLIPKLHYFELPDTDHKAMVEGYYCEGYLL